MEDIVLKIITKLGLNSGMVLKKPIRGTKGITVLSLITSIVQTNNLMEAAQLLDYTSEGPMKQCISTVLLPLFPERQKSFGSGGFGRASWRSALLSAINYKYCHDCNTCKDKSNFGRNKGKGLEEIRSQCNNCHTYNSKLRKLDIVRKTPTWANLTKIKEIYSNCPPNMQVDHIIPLNGKLVTGLHIETNLQYLTEPDNLEKSNKYIQE